VPIKTDLAKLNGRIPSERESGRTNRWTTYCYALGLAFALFPLLAMHSQAQVQTYSDKVLYSFSGGTDGNEPLFSGVVQDKAGNFYGTTFAAGAFTYGTVFKVDISGNETVLHSFGQGHDGRTPYAGVVIDPADGLFGTTYQGGTPNPQCQMGCGIVFEIQPNRKEKVLHEFTGGIDGGLPFGGLIRDSNGNLYGTTEIGGASGVGAIF
jgi:uncharacterized repeat protein (TIGR03803 family)